MTETKEKQPTVDKGQPIEWFFRPDAKLEITAEQYKILYNLLEVFRFPLAVMNDLKNDFIQTKQYLPVYDSDAPEEEIETINDKGEKVMVKTGKRNLRADFFDNPNGIVKEEKKTNSLSVDQLEKATSK